MNISDLIKDNFVDFLYYEDGVFYYEIIYDLHTYMYPVPAKDKLFRNHMAKDHEKYIKDAIDEGTFRKLI